MRSISVTYRAIFEQPIGVLNPMECKLPGPQPVEIFRKGKGGTWMARECATARRVVYERLGEFSSLDAAKRGVEQCFKSRREVWQIWALPPNERDERMLTPDELCDLGDGKFGWIEAEDRTHIMQTSRGKVLKIDAGYLAACGAAMREKHFISTKANVEPTCKACAEVWRKEYQTK